MATQLFFDLDFTSARTTSASASLRKKRIILQRCVLRWLEQNDAPSGLATDVVTRISKLRADVGAFWSVPIKNTHREGPTQILTPARTAIIQCCSERDDCWPDCIRSGQILPQLRQLKQELVVVEKQIRKDEPRLREDNTLFEEYAEWRYENSANREYHRLKRAVAKMEHGLYHGTKFERIRSVQLASHLYLAVPSGVVQKEELADGWGLLWVEDDLSVRVIAEADERECLPSNRLHLVQNIAAAAKRTVLFAHGLKRGKAGQLVMVKPPHARRLAAKERLSES